jgi:hypothetical protein
MWPSEEFDAIRWRLASHTERLLRYPAVSKTVAPPVLVNTAARTKTAPDLSPYDAAAQAGNVKVSDLADGFAAWRNGTAEGKTEITDAAGRAAGVGLRWTIAVDHKKDGGEGGTYPVGWPRLAREFKQGELDLSRADTLEFWIRVDSNRDEVADDRTRIGLMIGSHRTSKSLYSTTVNLGDAQRTWVPVRFSLKQMIAAADAGLEPWTSISRLQLFISEHDYAHGTRLVFDLGGISALQLTAPVIAGIDAPRHFLVPRATLAFTFDLIGTGAAVQGSHTVIARLEKPDGTGCAEAKQDAGAPGRLALPLKELEPGSYNLRLMIRDAQGKQCSEMAQPVTAHAGPGYWRF